jgi:acyl-CoA synthetase (AMP-forming)/AMP-acid ligase II
VPLPAAPFTADYANLLELFDAVVAQCGDVEAFVDGNGPAADRARMTFAQWARAADGVATRLTAMGVEQGDVVGISLPSSIEYAVAYQGVVRVGAIASGMNPKLGLAETEHIIAKSSPKVIITDALNVTDPSVAVLSVDELRDAYAVHRPHRRLV